MRKAMEEDEALIDIATRRIALNLQLKELRQDVNDLKLIHKKSFWSLYHAESKLCKAKIRKLESDIKSKNSWTKRVWELFKVMRFRKLKKK